MIVTLHRLIEDDEGEVEYEIDVKVSGGCRATRFEPAEGPDVEIVAVRDASNGARIRVELWSEIVGDWADLVRDALDAAQEAAEDARWSRGDEKYHSWKESRG